MILPRITVHAALFTLCTAIAFAAPPDARTLEQAVARGVEILLERQENFDNIEGHVEWPYEGVYRVPNRETRKYDIPIGYRIGGTSICAWALIEAPGWNADAKRQEAVAKALDFVLHALEDKRMTADFKRGYDVRGWGHTYALTFFARLQETKRVPKGRGDAVKAWIGKLAKILQHSEIEQVGGWNYSRRGDPPSPSTFMTASTVQALLAARAAGEKIDDAVLGRALKSMEDARLDTGAIQDATSERKSGKGFEAVPGATGRMPICETTLLVAGRGSAKRVEESVAAFLEHWEWLEKRRRKDRTHIPPYMIAPYYFYYAHYYAAQAIECLPKEKRKLLRAGLLQKMFGVREKSGGWNDRVFDRSENFGTAMAILAILEPQIRSSRAWMHAKAPTKP